MANSEIMDRRRDMSGSGEEGVRAPRGEKMIEVAVRFWTNGIAEKKGRIVPRHCWDGGTISMVANKSHSLKASHLAFNSLSELPAEIEALLIRHGIRMHHGNRSWKLFDGE